MSSKILMKNTKKVSLKIVLASDHAGFERKNELLELLERRSILKWKT